MTGGTHDLEDQLNKAIVEYSRRIEQGESIDRNEFLRRDPSIADGLRAYFENLDFAQSLAADAKSPSTRDTEIVRDTNRGPHSVQRPDGLSDAHRHGKTPFGPYLIKDVLGKGGMGVVYLATERKLSDVVLSVFSSDTTEVAVSPENLTFTPSDWDVPVTVMVTGVDDLNVDDDQATTVTIAIDDAESADAFDELTDQTVAVTTTDDDVAGFTVSRTTALVSESGTTDTVTVVLDAAPLSDVVLMVVSSDTEEVTVLPATLTFTPSDWDVAQTVTVDGVNDHVVDGDQTTDVVFMVDVAFSDDAFDGLAARTVTVTTTDDGADSLRGNVDGDFDSNDTFLMHLALLAGTDEQINQSKGSSPLTPAEIRAGISQLGIVLDVDGDQDFDANDSFLIHLVRLAGTDAQTDQSKGNSPLTASQIRANVASLGDGSGDGDGDGRRRGFDGSSQAQLPLVSTVLAASSDLSASTEPEEQLMPAKPDGNTFAPASAFLSEEYRTWIDAIQA
ncbi:MAG: hypothetical protein P8J37_17445 [Fuerstiella sp.]|nr:hypothetical protein [Fuerstiella sp.]